MINNQAQKASARSKTACAECRQQKMRCEADPGTLGSSACSRCRRLKIPCVFSAPFKRTHKRKRLEELEGEATALKRQLLAASTTAPDNLVPSSDTPLARQEEAASVSQVPLSKMSHRKDPTLPRTIGGLELASVIIDDCFELYFKDYHFMVPILDPTKSPNAVYQHAPSLFWVIIAVGSRRYTRQPTLIRALALPVTQLVLQSIIIRTKPIERIKAMILLLNWPFPCGHLYRDPSFLLGGPLLHMAMHCRLHATTSNQEFSKAYSTLPEQEILRRAEVWAYVVITYQRLCSASGQANLVSFELYNEQTNFKSLMEKLPATLRLQLQTSNIISRGHKTLLQLGLLSMTPQQERTMDAFLKGFDTELDGLEHLASSNWDPLYIASARLNFAVMHFYKSATALDMNSSLLIFNAAASVLEIIQDLYRDCALHRTCTQLLLTTALLSLVCMARILKGPFAEYLDQVRGSNLIESGVRFAQSCSIQKGDFADRTTAVAKKIWKSKKIFREPDGSINITLRVRNRLSSGPWHDAVKCWQEEFLNPDCALYAPGIDAEPAALPGTTDLDAAPASGSVSDAPALSSFPPAPDFLLDNEMWGDLGLGLSDSWDIPGSDMSWVV